MILFLLVPLYKISCYYEGLFLDLSPQCLVHIYKSPARYCQLTSNKHLKLHMTLPEIPSPIRHLLHVVFATLIFHNSILLIVPTKNLGITNTLPYTLCQQDSLQDLSGIQPLLLNPLCPQYCAGSWSCLPPTVTSTPRVSRTFDNLSQTILMLKSIHGFFLFSWIFPLE